MDSKRTELILKKTYDFQAHLQNQIHELEIALRLTNMRIVDLENEMNKRRLICR